MLEIGTRVSSRQYLQREIPSIRRMRNWRLTLLKKDEIPKEMVATFFRFGAFTSLLMDFHIATLHVGFIEGVDYFQKLHSELPLPSHELYRPDSRGKGTS